MDEFIAYYLNGYYGIPITAVHTPQFSPPLDQLDPGQIEALLQMQSPVETATRIYGWLDAQIESPDHGAPAQDYFSFYANYPSPAEFDGDLFIRSEVL
jgi:hypothetical protein